MTPAYSDPLVTPQTLWLVSVRVRGRWEYWTTPKAIRPTESEAKQVGHIVDAMRPRGEPSVVDAVRILRVEEHIDQEVEP